MVDAKDLEALAYLATLPGARDTLIGNANTDGTAWMYAVAGLHPLWTHYDYPVQQGPGYHRFIFWAYADDADTDPRVAEAVKALNIRYVVTSTPVVRGFVMPDGLVSLDKSRSWEKIYDNGEARIYEWRGDVERRCERRMTTNTDDDNIEIIGGDPVRDGRGGRRRQVVDRSGRAAGQGDADRHDDQAAARGGARRTAGRRQPQPAARDPPAPAFASSRTGWRRNCATSWSGSRCRSPRTASRPTPNCGSRRPSWSAGSRACSTASRPRCSPSRWRPVSSWSRCGRAHCRPAWAARTRGGPRSPGTGQYL